jgi:protein-disulfide isomerase-like protein with CxxC motif
MEQMERKALALKTLLEMKEKHYQEGKQTKVIDRMIEMAEQRLNESKQE